MLAKKFILLSKNYYPKLKDLGLFIEPHGSKEADDNIVDFKDFGEDQEADEVDKYVTMPFPPVQPYQDDETITVIFRLIMERFSQGKFSNSSW